MPFRPYDQNQSFLFSPHLSDWEELGTGTRLREASGHRAAGGSE